MQNLRWRKPDERDMLVRPLRRLLGLIVLASSLFVLRHAVRDASRFFLFPASRVPAITTPDDFVVHELVAKDGVRVRALELPAPDDDRSVVVYFHTNRETAESRAPIARALHARGLGVVLAEYRGFGWAATGTPSEEGLYLDAEAVLDMLAARGIGTKRVVLWGTSLGTGVAAEMARRGRGSKLVLLAPYTSIPDLVTNAAPVVPAALLIDDRFDTLAKSADIHVPTLVVHGDADEIVPFAMGERLSRSIRGATLLRVRGGHHGDLFEREPDRVLDAMSALIDGPDIRPQ